MFISKKSLSLKRPVAKNIQSVDIPVVSIETQPEQEKKEEKPSQPKKTAQKKANNDKENSE